MEVGDEGMLIETREVQKKALGKEALYEIVIGVEEDMIPSTYAKQKTINATTSSEKRV